MKQKIEKLFKLACLILFLTMATSQVSAQSQVGNPTNAYWDGVNLPMAEVEPGVYAIYSGDINQDGTVDGADMNFVESDATDLLFGYLLSDLTGEGAPDGADMNIVEQNTSLLLFIAKP
jgi:hypothetical protein